MNSFVLSEKTIPNLREFHNKIASLVPEFDGFLKEDSTITVMLKVAATPELVSAIEAIVPPAPSQIDYVKTVIANSITFGQSIIAEFAAENVMMGITQEDMTGPVRKNMAEIISALSTGSLYDAIVEAKNLPEDKKDSKYVTDARLLQFVNKIETYLNIPLSTEL